MLVDCLTLCIVNVPLGSQYPVLVQLCNDVKRIPLPEPLTWTGFVSKVHETFSAALNEANQGQFSLYFIPDLSIPVDSRVKVTNQKELELYLVWRAARSHTTQLFLHVPRTFQSDGKPTSPVRPPPINTTFSNGSPVITSPSSRQSSSPRVQSPSPRVQTPIPTPSPKVTNYVQPRFAAKHIKLQKPVHDYQLSLQNSASLSVSTHPKMYRVWDQKGEFFRDLSTDLKIEEDAQAIHMS